MGTQAFTVLYTHQKLKKAKVWQDGLLKISHLGNKAILYDDKGQCLESIFLKCLEVKPGDDLEGDRYLITVEDVTVAGPAAVGPTLTKMASDSGRCVPSGRAQGCQPAGLKRKFTGFQGPRQVPLKGAVMEKSELTASLEARTAGPPVLSPLYDTSPLFATAGREDMNRPSDPENTVAYESRERTSVLPFSVPAASTPAFKLHAEAQGPESKRSRSFLAEEPERRDGWSPHHSGAPHIRSQARILALLKARPAAVCPQGQPHSRVTSPQPGCSAEQAGRAEGKRPEGSQQPPSGTTSRKTSRWAVYLPSQRSPEHSSDEEESDPAGKPTAQDTLALNRELSFEAHAEGGGVRGEDSPVAHHDPPWDQEAEVEIPSRESGGACSHVGSGDLLSESGIQESSKSRLHQSKPLCPRESLLFRENAEESIILGGPEQESESVQLQTEPSLGSDARVSGDLARVLSKDNSDLENLTHLRELGENVEQPLVEVTFNLNNFEDSDSEEESQESHKMPHDPGGRVEDTSVPGGHPSPQRQHEGASCPEDRGAPLPLLMSLRGEPTEPLSQFCDKIHVGFCSGRWKAGNMETEQELSDPASNLASALAWPDDDHVDNSEEAHHSSVSVSNDLASPARTSKKTEPSLLTPHISSLATNQPPEHSLFSGQAQPFVWGNNSDVKNEQALLPSTLSGGECVQLLNRSAERTALGECQTQVSNCSVPPLGTRRPTAQDSEGHIPKPKDSERIQKFPHSLTEVGPAGRKPYSSGPKSSSGPSGFLDDISLLKSLSEHSTALEGLETMRRTNTACKQHSLQTPESGAGREAGASLTAAASRAVPKSPHLDQDSHQFFSLESEEAPTCAAVTPKHVETAACDPQPVEFQGHQVKGSAAGAVMVRGPGTAQIPGSIQRERYMAHAWSVAPQMPSTGIQADFLQFPSEEYFPKGGASFNIEDSYQEITESENDSFENDSMKRPGFLDRTLAGLPLLSRTQAPRAALPPDFPSRPDPLHCDGPEAPAYPQLSWQEDPALPASGFGPEHPGKTCFPQAPRATTPEAAPSKWLKYQSITRGGMASPGRVDSEPADGVCTRPGGGTGPRQQDALHEGPANPERLQRIKDMLGPQQQASCSQRPVSGSQTAPEVNGSELRFPSAQETKSAHLPQRRLHIPAVFQSPAQYKHIFTSCLIEHLNIMLFGLAQRLHRALAKVDISFYTSPGGQELSSTGQSTPPCHHQQPAKLVMGRLFYACDAPKADQCKFFKWFEAVAPGCIVPGEAPPVKVLSDIKSIGLYLRSQKIPVYEECQLLVRKGFDFQRKQYGKLKKFAPINPEFYNDEPKSRLYLKLSRKESSSTYSKDDLWVVSKTLDFELDTFIACSAFFGPSSASEVELLPLKGYFPSKWPTNTVVHALLVCNASTELTTLKNIQDHVNPATLPLTRFLLTMSPSTAVSHSTARKRKFTPPAFSALRPQPELLALGPTLALAGELIRAHQLNQDQAAALTQIARMMAAPPDSDKAPRASACPITIIHGVFGAGKSHLLALVVLFFVQLFEKSEASPIGNVRPWKVLISSSTNVAVDRVLLGLLSLGFEKFVRVGSVRKIAKPILPYSLHAGSENESEQLKELQALMREGLSAVERAYVRKSIEQHRLGTNRTLLRQVRVVGVTCAACPFPCMNDLKFPVVVLDECSQITEPASLLPIARFECEKLILVGDPKQLSPTIQGSDAAHDKGLEQTLFDRLCLMGHEPVLLRTQYRCHPAISAIVNDLFYEGHLLDGVSDAERGPLLTWLPTVCFYNVRGLEQMDRDNSFHNVAEAAFTLKLIRSMLASGVAGAMIGVITLYKSQTHKLCQALAASDLEQPGLRAVQVSTVDAFQGAEKEVIILSCVRTRHMGFIDSERRMNVALTRGRRHLLIVGHLGCLRENRLWGRVIQHCQGREGGLQHASQLEPQLDQLLKDHLEEQAKRKRETERPRDGAYSQKAAG